MSQPAPFFIADAVMEDRILKASLSTAQKTTEVSLDFEEKNALCYTAEYIMRALEKNVLQSAHPLKRRNFSCAFWSSLNQYAIEKDHL